MITRSRRFKKKKRSPFYLMILLILLASGAAIFLLNLNLKIFKQRAEVNQELNFLKEEFQELGAEKENLLFRISEAETEEFLERYGREDFNFKKQGEKVVAFFFPIIEEKSPFAKGTSTERFSPEFTAGLGRSPTEGKEEKESFWQEILKKLGIR